MQKVSFSLIFMVLLFTTLFSTAAFSAPKPPVLSVNIDANPLTINTGGSSTLSWTSKNATTVSINQGIGTVAANGSMTITPSVTTTYTITAARSTASVTDSVTVAVSTAVTWNKTFGGTAYDIAASVQETTDGGYIVAGGTISFGAGYFDAWLIKTDAYGNGQWDKTFGGSSYDVACSAQQTTDGGYITIGHADSFSAGFGDFWLIKTDAYGNEQWDNIFDYGDLCEAASGQQTADGGYIMAGYIQSGENTNALLIKTDAYGNELWHKTFGGSFTSQAFSVQQTADGGYISAGYTTLNNAGRDGWLMKTDANGNVQWNKAIGGSKEDYFNSVQQTADGGYILAGYVQGSRSVDAWLVKTDGNGNVQWNKKFGGKMTDEAKSVRQTADGGYIVAAYTNSYGAGGNDCWIIKTDANGNALWSKTFGGINEELAESIQQTADGGYIVVGTTYSFGVGDGDVWVIKTDEYGNAPATPSN